MGRTIIGQVVAGTRMDRHGDRLSKEELTTLFENWPEDLPAGVNHDLSQPPVCRSFNKRLEEEADGELALKVDVEVFDEARFAEFGGFSVSFRVPVIILVVEPDCQPSDIRLVDGKALIRSVEAQFGALPIQRVTGRIRVGGVVEIRHVTATDGRVVYRAHDDA